MFQVDMNTVRSADYLKVQKENRFFHQLIFSPFLMAHMFQDDNEPGFLWLTLWKRRSNNMIIFMDWTATMSRAFSHWLWTTLDGNTVHAGAPHKLIKTMPCKIDAVIKAKGSPRTFSVRLFCWPGSEFIPPIFYAIYVLNVLRMWQIYFYLSRSWLLQPTVRST